MGIEVGDGLGKLVGIGVGGGEGAPVGVFDGACDGGGAVGNLVGARVGEADATQRLRSSVSGSKPSRQMQR